MILNFQAVENAHNYIPRERRPEGRRDFKRSEDRKGGKPQGNRRGPREDRHSPREDRRSPREDRRSPREDRRSTPKINLKNEKAFPKL